MPICGNCKQHHDHTSQIRDCYGLASNPGSTTPGTREEASSFLRGGNVATATRPSRLATEKQVDFITRLWKEKYPDTSKEALDAVKAASAKLQRSEASKQIDELMSMPTPKPAAQPEPDVKVESIVRDGTYTVEMGDGTHVTLRFRKATWAKDLPDGSQVIEFLSGSDNEFDYTGFAFMVNGRPRVWSKFRAESRITAALQFLLTGDVDEAHERFLEKAEAYALESGNCMRCLRKLTVTESITRGLGPVCAKIELA